MAKTLHGAGLKENDVIAVISENRHEITAISFGAFYLNAVVAPINITYTESKSLPDRLQRKIIIFLLQIDFFLGELKHALDLSKPKFIFVSPYAARKTVAVAKKLKFVRNVILIEGRKIDNFVVSLNGLIRKHEKVEFNVEDFICGEVDTRDQSALIVCSSGTTGLPKGVLITQENMMTTHQTYSAGVKLRKSVQDFSIVGFNVAPWFHVLGFIAMFLFSTSEDAVYIFLPKFDEISFYRSIEVRKLLISLYCVGTSFYFQAYKINLLILVPPIMVLLAKSPQFNKFDLSSVKGKN